MIPSHGYPGLKKYDHLVGNFGSAWQNQQKNQTVKKSCNSRSMRPRSGFTSCSGAFWKYVCAE